MFRVSALEREFDERITQVPATQFLRHFGVNQFQCLRRSLVRKERSKPVRGQLETTCCGIVDD